MLYRLILPQWKLDEPGNELPKTFGDYELEMSQVLEFNELGYNCYWLPNYPANWTDGQFVQARDVDTFEYVFVDMDLKEGKFKSKQEFLERLAQFKLKPTNIVDSGNGIHAYWRVTDLDQMSFLRIQRRLCRALDTDETVGKLVQLMRVPGTKNTKDPENIKVCKFINEPDGYIVEYTCEQLDKSLPPITQEDEAFCVQHFNRSMGLEEKVDFSEQLPKKWFKLAKKGSEAYKLFYGQPKDRSIADYRLAHLLQADGFTEEEALSVLVNTSKASDRSPDHRYNYAKNIVDKVWEEASYEIQDKLKMGRSAFDLIQNQGEELTGTRFPCSELFDATEIGFRLGHVIGLVGGAGSGKTAMTMNYFYHFVKENPTYDHVFFSLEQPAREIAQRWANMTRDNPSLAKKVIIVDNYGEDGTFRNLSLQECKEYVEYLQKSGIKVGCVVVDHIGILKAENKNGEFQGIQDICMEMKAFAQTTNTLLVMQSQAPREKAGAGDIELNKDAAYGTSKFEWFVDWLVTTWQPLKRVYSEAPDMTITCYKYCKIRHKKVKKDRIQEDRIYALHFNPDTELMTELTQDQWESYKFFVNRATTLRNQDVKKDPRGLTETNWMPKKRTKSKESA